MSFHCTIPKKNLLLNTELQKGMLCYLLCTKPRRSDSHGTCLWDKHFWVSKSQQLYQLLSSKLTLSSPKPGKSTRVTFSILKHYITVPLHIKESKVFYKYCHALITRNKVYSNFTTQLTETKIKFIWPRQHKSYTVKPKKNSGPAIVAF